MTTLKILFWVFLFILFYAYIGYGILLYILVKLKRWIKFGHATFFDPAYEPDVTLFVAGLAY